ELWFTRDGAFTAIGILAAVWGGYFVVRRLSRFSRKWGWNRGNHRQHVRVEFFERFLKLTARRGLQTTDGQTPREFCQTTSRALVELLQPAGLDTLPAEVAEQFYR